MRTAIFSKPGYLTSLHNEYTSYIYWLYLCSTSLCVFLFDLSTPLGVAAGAPYALVVFGSLWFNGNQTTHIATITGILLTLAGFFLSPNIVAPMDVVLTNRVMALMLITVTAFSVLKIKKANLELSALLAEIYTDPFTQCKNNRAFETELITEIKRSKRYKRDLSLAFFDIHFHNSQRNPVEKNTNNHNEQLIKNLFQEVKKFIRISDQLYRVDDDQFAIMFVETDIHKAREVCNALCEKVSKMDQLNEPFKLTISAGIAMLDNRDNKRKLCKRAEDALLIANKDGKYKVSTLPETTPIDRSHIPAILSRPRSG